MSWLCNGELPSKSIPLYSAVIGFAKIGKENYRSSAFKNKCFWPYGPLLKKKKQTAITFWTVFESQKGIHIACILISAKLIIPFCCTLMKTVRHRSCGLKSSFPCSTLLTDKNTKNRNIWKLKALWKRMSHIVDWYVDIKYGVNPCECFREK